ncbi:MAG: nucleotidyltransferase domain-containing protein [Mariprofundaceae bacterium]|nr:nucleotidyltransferase domain-containing protein [Mariprofundaceae bacterium]
MQIYSRDLAIVKDLLCTHIPELEVWAFGSRVHGRTLKKFSDIDLAVIGEAPIEAALLEELKEAFDASDLPFRVDVVDYASASQTFRDIIQREHEVIQASRKETSA